MDIPVPKKPPDPLRCILLLVALLLAGCATHADRVTQLRSAYYGNDLASAAAAIDAGLASDSRNADVLRLDLAMVQLSSGQAHEAEQTLRMVRDRFDELDGHGKAQAALSYLTDDSRRAYAGEDYEQVLIRAMLALANLMHDGGDAEAYSLQLIDKQEQIIAAGANSKGENSKLAYQRVALAPYLRGVLREATHLDYDDAERSFVNVVNWQPGFQAGKSDLARAAQGTHSAPGNGVLYVFALTGRGPYKQEVVEVPSSAALLIAGEIVSAVGSQTVPPNVAPVKVARVVAYLNGVQALAVAVNGQPMGRTETITDVTDLAVRQYEAIFPQVVARAVARRIVKKGTVYGAKEISGIGKGSLPGLAFDLAGIAWEATESADTRCWGLLPDKIQVLRVELPAGTHEISLRPLLAGGAAGIPTGQNVEIGNGRNTYLLATVPQNRVVGRVLVSQP
ncbi:MAG: hypothetical protein WD872_04965 [Pirellulaceae bacterium]